MHIRVQIVYDYYLSQYRRLQEAQIVLVWHCTPPTNKIHTVDKVVFKQNSELIFYYQYVYCNKILCSNRAVSKLHTFERALNVQKSRKQRNSEKNNSNPTLLTNFTITPPKILNVLRKYWRRPQVTQKHSLLCFIVKLCREKKAALLWQVLDWFAYLLSHKDKWYANQSKIYCNKAAFFPRHNPYYNNLYIQLPTQQKR